MATEYKIILSNKFDNSFSKLDRGIQNRIVDRLKDLSMEPRLGKPLKGNFKDMWSLRVGNYRILYQIRDEHLIIAVIAVGHRKRVYR